VRITGDSVVLQRLASAHWEAVLKALVAEHAERAQSSRAQALLADWERERERFWQVCPKEMVDRLAHPLSDAKAPRRRRA
jgi:glutamate synthase (NADPH/NADH) large chain